MSDRLTFDTVIATRNRPEALALSIPLILRQSRQTQKLIIIDSSDDHQAVKSVVEQAVRDWPGEVILRASERGSSLQRNIGLEHVTADVVFFPDDDSMLYPGTTEAIMRVYERDRSELVSGVCTAAALMPPPDFPETPVYTVSREMKRQMLTTPIKNKLRKLFNSLDPIFYIGRSLMQRYEVPTWLQEENCVLVEFMSGYRMSFRTAVIKQFKFNENLGEYAHCEDYDASFSAAAHGAIVGARNGRIYHHKYPGARSSAFKMGVMRILNTAYVVLKHSRADTTAPQRKDAMKHIKTFGWAFQIIYISRLRNPYNRNFLSGFRAGVRNVHLILNSSEHDLDNAYQNAMSHALSDMN